MDLTGILQSYLGGYVARFVTMGLTAIATKLAITPDAALAPAISNFTLACIVGGIGLIWNHFSHAAVHADPAAPKA